MAQTTAPSYGVTSVVASGAQTTPAPSSEATTVAASGANASSLLDTTPSNKSLSTPSTTASPSTSTQSEEDRKLAEDIVGALSPTLSAVVASNVAVAVVGRSDTTTNDKITQTCASG